MGCRKLQLNDYFKLIKSEQNDSVTNDSVTENISYSYNDNDQLTLESNSSKGDTVYTYDANGSQIGKVGQNESYMYAYNLQNRLSTATITRTETEPMGVSKLVDITSSYVYNQSGIRVGANTSTAIDGGTAEIKDTVYLTDPSNFTGYSQVIEESVNGTLTKSYTLGDDVISQTSTLGVRHFAYDGHGSTRLLTNSSSAIANRFDYDAYGKNLFSANVTNPSATDMLYSGEQFDPNLQMQYLRARYYDQNNGRFNRLDPFSGNMGDPQSLHKYAYCHGNPIMGIDPSGLMNLGELLMVQGAIAFLNAHSTTILLTALVSVTSFGLYLKYGFKTNIFKEPYLSNIKTSAKKWRLTPEILAAIIGAEISDLNIEDFFGDVPGAYLGHQTSIGLGQVNIATAIKYNK